MNQHNISKISFCLPSASSIKKGKESVINNITRLIQDDEQIGFAGYLRRRDLRRDLYPFIFGISEKVNLPDLKKDEVKIQKIIQNVVKKCQSYYTKIPPLNIFVFPTQDPFVLKEMRGINGFAPHKRTIHLYVNPNINIGWPKNLSLTVAHEIAHAISYEQFEWRTLLDSLIFEGLAEHFREQIIDGGKAPWTAATTKEYALFIIKKLEEENLLESNDNDLYLDLFFGGERFLKWSGYTIGYIIVQTILKYGNFKVIDLLQTPPDMIYMLYKRTVQRKTR